MPEETPLEGLRRELGLQALREEYAAQGERGEAFLQILEEVVAPWPADEPAPYDDAFGGLSDDLWERLFRRHRIYRSENILIRTRLDRALVLAATTDGDDGVIGRSVGFFSGEALRQVYAKALGRPFSEALGRLKGEPKPGWHAPRARLERIDRAEGGESRLDGFRRMLGVDAALRRIEASEVADRMLPLAREVLVTPRVGDPLGWARERYGTKGRFEFDGIFERASGVRFESFVKRGKLDRVLRLVAETDRSLDEIAGMFHPQCFALISWVSDEARMEFDRYNRKPSLYLQDDAQEVLGTDLHPVVARLRPDAG